MRNHRCKRLTCCAYVGIKIENHIGKDKNTLLVWFFCTLFYAMGESLWKEGDPMEHRDDVLTDKALRVIQKRKQKVSERVRSRIQ